MTKVVSIPRYAFWVLALAALLGPILSFIVSIHIANNNAAKLVDDYRADRAKSQAANQTVYCTLFGSQLDAFDNATSPAGQASYRAWLAVYKLVHCQPERR